MADGNVRRGRFVTFEGVEGAGKSTQIERARSHLARSGVDAVFTREPGGTPLAEAVRTLLLDPAYRAMSAQAELLLVFAARSEHIDKVIEPALARGQWVVCDRFTDATFAYQGAGRRIGNADIERLESQVQGELRPDLTVILDLDVPTGLARIAERGEKDRFETEDRAFFERIRSAYLERARRHPSRYRVVDAARSEREVAAEIGAALDGLSA